MHTIYNILKANPRGQTLIEMLIALSLAGVIMTVLTTIIISSLNNAQFSKNQNLATKYAQEGSEIVRTIRNSDYVGFRGYDGTYCLAAGQQVLGGVVAQCNATNVSNFVRSVSIQQVPGCGANIARVTISVAWADSACQVGTFCHKSQLISCLSTISTVQGP